MSPISSGASPSLSAFGKASLSLDFQFVSTIRNLDVELFQVSKTSLRREQSVSETYVHEAQRWASALLEREHRGPGDTLDAAMWRAEQKWGIDHSTFWALRYRPPREMFVSVYMRLRQAYEMECVRQEARLQHELMLAKAAGLHAHNSPVVAEVEALLGAKESKG